MSTTNNRIPKKILLTGSSGFIGSYLKSRLIKDNVLCCPVRNFDLKENEFFCNLTLAEDVSKLKFEPDVIIHCAANPASKYSENTVSQVRNNVFSTLNLLEKFDNCHFINISSILVYQGNNKTEKPKTVYGSTKLFTDNLCENYEKIKNIHVTNLRIPITLGPNLKHGVVFDVINKIKNADTEISLLGKEPGSQKPFLHVEDLFTTISGIINNKKYGTFLVAPEDNTNVIEIANIVMRQLNKTVEVKWTGESWPGDDNRISIKPDIMVNKTSKEAIELAVKENLC